MRILMIAIAAMLLPLWLSGCSTQRVTGPEEVHANDNQFDPVSLKVKENDKVKWTNHGQNTHTVTIHKVGDPITTLKKDTTLDVGASTEYTFPEEGTYHVYCKYHSQGSTGMFSSGMVMTVTVEETRV